MGYRSDVYMCIKGPTELILAGIATLRLQGDAVMHSALDEWNVTAVAADTAVMVLGGQGTNWKWYDSYLDVQAHTAIFHHFEEITEETDHTMIPVFDGAFVRIGENDNDIEFIYFGDSGYNLGAPQRSIFRAYTGEGTDLRPRIAATQTP